MGDRPFRCISLGAGTQSTAMVYMACRGELPMPDAAIFADTQREPDWVYETLERTREDCGDIVDIYRVTEGDLLEDATSGERFASLPLFTKDESGKVSMLRRQCTREYKIAAVKRKIRELAGLHKHVPPENSAEIWLGISMDEIGRMKDSPTRWTKNRWPLIELRMTRQDCERWMMEHAGYVPKKSSCVFCPFHSDDYWRDLQKNHPEVFQEAVEADRELRHLDRIDDECYLHRSGVPLGEIDFNEQGELFSDGWQNECSGHCGL